MSAPLPLNPLNVTVASLCTVQIFVPAVSTTAAGLFFGSPIAFAVFVISSFVSALLAVPAMIILGAPLAVLITRLLSNSNSVLVHVLSAAAVGAITGATVCLVIGPAFDQTLDDYGLPALTVAMVLTTIAALSAAAGWVIAWVVHSQLTLPSPTPHMEIAQS